MERVGSHSIKSDGERKVKRGKASHSSFSCQEQQKTKAHLPVNLFPL